MNKLYKIWHCKNCGATVLCGTNYHDWEVSDHPTLPTFSEIVLCCSHPQIDWAIQEDDDVTGLEMDSHSGSYAIRLPDNDYTEPEKPESPQRSRVELVLEDYKITTRTCYHG